MQSTTDLFLLLKDLILRLGTAQDLESALSVVVQVICQQCNWLYGEAWRLDSQHNLLINQATFYEAECAVLSDEEAADIQRFGRFSEIFTFALEEGIPGRVWSSQEWEWHSNISSVDDEVFLRAKEVAGCGFRSAYGIPLVVGDRTLAVLLFFSDEVRQPEAQLVEVINAISVPIGQLVLQRQVEKQLRDSETHFRTFMDHSSAVIFVKDRKGLFTYVNRALEYDFNLQPGELIGKTDFHLLPEDAAKQMRENDAMVLSTNQPKMFVEVVPTPDGISRYWQVNKFPFTDQFGQKSVGGVAFDITQQKQYEQRLTLEKLEQQRINGSLKSVTKAAKAANRAKSSFLAMMSHEIRTPMNAMLGMTELLGGTNLDPQQQDFVNVIQTGGNTLLAVINDILDFSKIESHNLDLEVGCLDLYECVEQVLMLFSGQAEEKGLSLTSIVEPVNLVSLPNCFTGDVTRLRQVLSNLVSNSIKFTHEGEVSLQVRVGSVAYAALDESPTDYTLEFLVKDTGIGIDEKKMSQLFQPFSQLDASMTRRYGGTGLGLAISKQLIELMGGEIDVISKVGQGSTFRFSIGLSACRKSWQGDAMHGKGCQSIQDEISLDNKSLLIIDSNEISCRSLALQAQSWNLNVETVASVKAAFAKLLRSNVRFDAIAISEPLPDWESAQLAAQIRKFPHCLEVPLILLQVRPYNLSGSLPLIGGRAKRLHKPVRRSQFYNALIQLQAPESASQLDAQESSTIERLSNSNLGNGGGPSLVTDAKLSNRKPLSILLAEDILLNQKVALRMLATYGYQADVAHTGKEAVEALQKRSYDLVLMDVQMPEMDGLEATRTIRADPHIEQPYIVAMTAHAMQGDRADCLSVGMNDYIRKPVRRRDLAAVLRQCSSEKTAKTMNKEASEKSMALIREQPADAPLTLDTTIIEGIDTDTSFLREVCDSFLGDAPERIRAVQTALEQADAEALEQTAHALKSLSSCIGAMCLFQLCKSLEDIGKSNCIEPALPLMEEVVSEYATVQLAVEAYRETL